MLQRAAGIQQQVCVRDRSRNWTSNKPDRKPIIKTTAQLSKQVVFIKPSGMAAVSKEMEHYLDEGKRNVPHQKETNKKKPRFKMAEEQSLNLQLERMYGLCSMSVHPSGKRDHIYTAPILRALSIHTHTLSHESIF